MTEYGFRQQGKGPLAMPVHVPLMIGMAGTLSPLIYRAAFPPGCRLTTQQLVDLLKMPSCYGQARRLVLDHLGYLHGRSFVNHWAFVRFAGERKLDVDLTSPPRRPDPRASVERMLAILREHP